MIYYYSANLALKLLITLGVPVAALIDADYVTIDVPEALPVAEILLADIASTTSSRPNVNYKNIQGGISVANGGVGLASKSQHFLNGIAS